MSDQERDNSPKPEEVLAFLQRLSRDKHAFGAHLGMRVERDPAELSDHERAKARAKAVARENDK